MCWCAVKQLLLHFTSALCSFGYCWLLIFLKWFFIFEYESFHVFCLHRHDTIFRIKFIKDIKNLSIFFNVKVSLLFCCRPKGSYGVPIQYERSFRWKLGQFRYLCHVRVFNKHDLFFNYVCRIVITMIWNEFVLIFMLQCLSFKGWCL